MRLHILEGRMKTLHLLKSEPDKNTETLIRIVSEGESTIFKLYEEDADYGRLLDLMFEYERIISWW